MKTLSLVLSSAALLAGLSGFAGVASAQPPAPAVGILGGLNIAELTGEDLLGAESRTDFMIGLSLSIARSTSITFQPELLYTRKGQGLSFSFSDETGDFDLEADLILSYLELPLLAKINFPQPGGRITPHLLFGPAFALRVACSAKVDLRVSSEEGSFHETAKGDCEDAEDGATEVNEATRFDIGLMFGGGLTFGRLNLGVRYNLGLLNVNSESGAGDIRNRVLSFVLGYRLSG